MIYCINPLCKDRENQDPSIVCESCGISLIVNNRFRLIKPLSPLTTSDEIEIFEALDLKGSYNSAPGKLKIIKVLKSFSTQRRTFFKRGAEIEMSLVHPRIPSVDIEDFFEVTIEGRWDTLLCLAMDKIEGLTLTQWVKKNGKINQRRAILWMQQLAEIIDYMHQERVLHRDIKPDNIMITNDENLYLIDFDGARRMTSTYFAQLRNVGGPITGIISGLYTAPEQFELKPVPQSDFYSLGMLFVFLLTGLEPSAIPKNEHTGRLMWSKIVQGLDPPFVKFIDNLIHPSISRRPSHSIELINILFVELPRRLRRYNILRSRWFRFATVSLAALVTAGLIHIGRIKLSEYYYQAGKMQANNADYVSARNSLDLSVMLWKSEPAYRAMALLCKYIVDVNCAEQNYIAATKINPKDNSPYYNLATFYEDQNKYEEAIKTYKTALDYNKDNPSILNNIARLYIKKRLYKEACEMLNEAQKIIDKSQTNKLPKTQAAIYKNKGWVLFLQKDFINSKNYLDKAISHDTNIVAPYCLLAQVNEALKKPAKKDWNICFFPKQNNIINPEDESLPEIYQWRHEHLNRGED